MNSDKNLLSPIKTMTFEMHPHLLYDVILRQAGTLAKALLEGVMNSIDAGCSRVEVLIGPNSFSIIDDGRGFGDEAEVRAYFATFGTPHKEGDARFGRFRMGRGQMFAFASTVWTTNEWRMEVDIKKRGLDFDFGPALEPLPGCKVEGNLYDPLNASEIIAVENELARNCLYVENPIIVNGRQVNLPPEEQEWDHRLDDAWISLQSGGTAGIAVYQQGVYVETIPANEYGMSGVIVTRAGCDLKVNFARNQVMRSCPRFRKCLSLLGFESRKRISRRTTLDDSEVESLWRIIYESVIHNKYIGLEFKEKLNARFIEDCTGRKWSPKGLLDFHREMEPAPDLAFVFTVGRSRDLAGDRMMQRKTAFVLSTECFAGLGGPDLTGRVQIVTRGLQNLFNILPSTRPRRVRFESYEAAANGIRTSHKLLTSDEITSIDQMILEALGVIGSYIAYKLRVENRVIRIGESETALAWTDGTGFIAIERRQVPSRGLDSAIMTRLGLLLLHEYCHNADSGTRHDHPPEFYRLYHDYSPLVPHLADQALRAYRRKLGKTARKIDRQRARRDEIEAKVQEAQEVSL